MRKITVFRIFLPALAGRASTRRVRSRARRVAAALKKADAYGALLRAGRALRRWAVPPGRRGGILNRENAVVTSKCLLGGFDLLCGFAAALRSPQETSRSQEMPGCSKQPNRRMGEITVFRIFLPALQGRASTRRVRPRARRVAAALKKASACGALLRAGRALRRWAVPVGRHGRILNRGHIEFAKMQVSSVYFAAPCRL